MEPIEKNKRKKEDETWHHFAMKHFQYSLVCEFNDQTLEYIMWTYSDLKSSTKIKMKKEEEKTPIMARLLQPNYAQRIAYLR